MSVCECDGVQDRQAQSDCCRKLSGGSGNQGDALYRRECLWIAK